MGNQHSTSVSASKTESVAQPARSSLSPSNAMLIELIELRSQGKLSSSEQAMLDSMVESEACDLKQDGQALMKEGSYEIQSNIRGRGHALVECGVLHISMKDEKENHFKINFDLRSGRVVAIDLGQHPTVTLDKEQFTADMLESTAQLKSASMGSLIFDLGGSTGDTYFWTDPKLTGGYGRGLFL